MGMIVVVGAGMVGRGLVGELFGEAGWRVRFLDVDEALVGELAAQGGYRHVTVDNERATARWIEPVTASLSDGPDAVDWLASADLVATAVGARVLPKLAPALVAAQARRTDALNVLLCENLHDADQALRDAAAAIDADQAARLGLVRTSIGRMIPVRTSAAAGQLTEVHVEPYGFLPVDAAAFRGEIALPKRAIVDRDVPFDFYADRKLYVHNLGHFLAALLGRTAGDEYVWQAIGRAEAREVVVAAMTQTSAALAQRHRQPVGPLLTHVEDLVHRFANVGLGDTIERVARDPGRKMAPGDRVLGAVELCRAERIPSWAVEFAARLGGALVAGRPWTWDEALAEVRAIRADAVREPVV